jgi:hypothetical protein
LTAAIGIQIGIGTEIDDMGLREVERGPSLVCLEKVAPDPGPDFDFEKGVERGPSLVCPFL